MWEVYKEDHSSFVNNLVCIKKGERTAENVKHKILTFRAKVLYLHEFFFHLKISELSKVFRFFSLIVFTFSDMTGAICL